MITLKNLEKSYANQCIFEKVNYTFLPRGIVSILGDSGSGKTTLVNLIAGFDTDYRGEIIIKDKPLSSMNQSERVEYRKNNIGFIFQNFNLIKGLTVIENIMLASTACNEVYDRADLLLKKFKIFDKKNQKVENLSGGQKQRVAIVRALLKQPSIIIADEPTGSLDHETAHEIMTYIKEISEDCLVLLITHDAQTSEYGDEIITIEDHNVVVKEPGAVTGGVKQSYVDENTLNHSMFNFALRNIKINLKQYLIVIIAISFGIFSLLFSFSFQNVIKHEIEIFKQNNAAFNNGLIKITDDVTIDTVKKDERLENVYTQSILENVTITLKDDVVLIPEKYPIAKAKESLSYGRMPKNDGNEIALSPSLAKKFSNNIDELIGKTISFTFNDEHKELLVSGIFNAGYDDFILSSKIEQEIYHANSLDAYSISYDVKEFEDISAVHKTFEDLGYKVSSASFEVDSLLSTFNTIQSLFVIVSIIIFTISLYISIMLLGKIQNKRYQEVGLYSALGYSKSQINLMLSFENIIVSMTTLLGTTAFLALTLVISTLLSLSFTVTLIQFSIVSIATFLFVLLITNVMSYRLLKVDTATALKKV